MTEDQLMKLIADELLRQRDENGPILFYREGDEEKALDSIRQLSRCILSQKALGADLSQALRSALRFAASRSAITAAEEVAILSGIDGQTERTM